MQHITTYLTANPDPQRGIKWQPDPIDLECLCKSVEGDIMILHDEDIPGNTTNMVKVDPIGNPYFARWEHILNNLPKFGNVCLLDATDTEVIGDGFPVKRNRLYVGHEQQTVGCDWMLENFYTEYMKPFFDAHADRQLLNCGVIIGHFTIIREFLQAMLDECVNDVGVMEMGIFNKVIYEQFAGRFEYGNHITTQFKKYEKNTTAWVRHK